VDYSDYAMYRFLSTGMTGVNILKPNISLYSMVKQTFKLHASFIYFYFFILQIFTSENNPENVSVLVNILWCCRENSVLKSFVKWGGGGLATFPVFRGPC
jgi:hypothetical protein